MRRQAGCFERVLQRGIVRRADFELAVLHAPIAVEHAARRRAGGAVAVGVVNAAVAGAHEQARLREPGDGAAQVGAVDRQDEELIRALAALPFVADEDAGERGDAVPGLPERIVEVDAARFVEREAGDVA